MSHKPITVSSRKKSRNANSGPALEVASLLESIVRQGRDEGVFDTDHPTEVAMIVSGMDLQLADAYIDAVRADGSVWPDSTGPRLQALLTAHGQALERILGASPGSLVRHRGDQAT